MWGGSAACLLLNPSLRLNITCGFDQNVASAMFSPVRRLLDKHLKYKNAPAREECGSLRGIPVRSTIGSGNYPQLSLSRSRY